jgi:hypothetical protein
MFSLKRVMIGGIVVSFAYVAFAATVPNPKPDAPLTTRQKIAKYIKPRVVDKLIDETRNKIVAFAMYEGAKWIGGPFRGGDEETTRELLTLVLTPSEWGQAPIKIVTKTMNPSQSASPVDDTPGADPATQSSRAPFPERQAHDAAPNPSVGHNDPSSHDSQAPDAELVKSAQDHSSVATPPTQQGHSREIGGASGTSAPAPSNSNASPFASGMRIGVGAPSDAGSGSTPAAQPADSGGRNQIELNAGGSSVAQAPEHSSDTKFNPNPEAATGTSAAPAPASAPAPAPAAHAPDRAGPAGGGPMGGAHEIGGGHDKPDHNTPSGGRDVSKIG